MFCAKKAIFPLSLVHLFSGFLGFGQECFPADMFLGVGIIVAVSVVASSGGCHRWFLDFVFYVWFRSSSILYFSFLVHIHVLFLIWQRWSGGRTDVHKPEGINRRN